VRSGRARGERVWLSRRLLGNERTMRLRDLRRRRARDPLRGAVVVITGATSGVGRATAHAFARRRAIPVLVARDRAALDAVVLECSRLRPSPGGADAPDGDGGSAVAAIAVAGDVGVADDVERIRATAVERFGRIDVWVNGAGILTAGVLGDESTAEVERLVQTNVLGTALCSRTALTQFRRQGGGTLINIASVLGLVPNPLVPVYTMSKFAVRGLSLSLHQMTATWPGVRVCAILPGPVDTPIFERAGNHTGRALRAIPPACAPERVAAAIVARAERPKRETIVGAAGKAIGLGNRFAPTFTARVVGRASAELLLRPEPAADTRGGTFGWSGETHVHGGWRRGRHRRRAGEAIGRWQAR